MPDTHGSRIPSMDFRGNKFTNEDGTLTELGQQFFDLLHVCLQKIIGSEGLVAPTQPSSNITIIQDNIVVSPTGTETNTCQFGTLIYDSTLNELRVALNNGSGAPIFKQVNTS